MKRLRNDAIPKCQQNIPRSIARFSFSSPGPEIRPQTLPPGSDQQAFWVAGFWLLPEYGRVGQPLQRAESSRASPRQQKGVAVAIRSGSAQLPGRARAIRTRRLLA